MKKIRKTGQKFLPGLLTMGAFQISSTSLVMPTLVCLRRPETETHPIPWIPPPISLVKITLRV